MLQHLCAGPVATLREQKGEVDQGFVVIRIEIEHLAVGFGSLRLAAIGIAYHAKEIKRLRRWAVLAQMGFAMLRRFRQAPLIAEPLGFIEAHGRRVWRRSDRLSCRAHRVTVWAQPGRAPGDGQPEGV